MVTIRKPASLGHTAALPPVEEPQWVTCDCLRTAHLYSGSCRGVVRSVPAPDPEPEKSASHPDFGGAAGNVALILKVQSWANNCAVYEAQHLAEGNKESAEYHRGAKEAFQRVVDCVAKGAAGDR
jgi:hypothetical protein